MVSSRFYTSQNNVHYALGLMANKAGQKEEAQKFFFKNQ